MKENNIDRHSSEAFADEQEFSLKHVILKLFRYWYWFIIAIVLCGLMAFFYIRYTTPSYMITSKILIKNDAKGGGGLGQQDVLNELDLFNTKNNVDDEVEVLKTRYLMSKVVNELQLNTGFFLVGKIKSTELYTSSPFTVKILSLRDSISQRRFTFQFKNEDSEFTFRHDSVKQNYHFNEIISTPHISFTVQAIPGRRFDYHDYLLTVNTIDSKVDEYLRKLKIDVVSKQTNVIQMVLTENVPAKGEQILNKLYEVYTRVNEEDKNKIADSTISFIDGRLRIVAGELSSVEKGIEQFKKSNNLSLDIQEQARMVLTNTSDLQRQLVQQEVQLGLVESIENHLKSQSPRIVPGTMAIQDPTYAVMVEKYNSLVLERDRQLETSKEDNPVVKNLNMQIANTRKDLLISLENIKEGIVVTKRELESKNNEFLGQLRTAPTKERAFLDISRQQDVKQQLYLYLLQKREETAISKSGTLSNSRLIEPAKSDGYPVKPKKSIIYLLALLAGVVLPAIILYLKEALNNKITNKKDIHALTSAPILGELGHNQTGETIVVQEGSRTALSEQFRAVRSNLSFILKGKEHQVIMFTSSMSGEGKSFLSINLACSLAISGKKVVLIEMDLRRPKIREVLNINNEQGFTNYMISDFSAEELPRQTSVHPNLHIIMSGPIPPNPAELLMQDKMKSFFDYLRSKFDFIIVDTPPVGLVTDATIIGKYVDATLYVVRQKFTMKPQLNIINDILENNKVPNLSILFNDVRASKSYGYGYGYGYGNGYGHGSNGYYTEEEKVKWSLKRRKGTKSKK